MSAEPLALEIKRNEEEATRWRYFGASVGFALFTLCACLIFVQVIVRPFIGMADNGDFPKVLGPLSLFPAYDVHHKAYIVPEFRRAPMYRWKSPLFTSEIYFARLAVGISRTLGNRDRFDIRYLGAVHSCTFLIAFLGLLILLRRFCWIVRILLALFSVWVFTDAAYVAYYNSFYSDVAALLALFLMVVLALLIAAQNSPSWLPLVGFVVSSLLFITSKGQHAILGFLPAAFIIWISWGWHSKHRAVVMFLAAILLLATALQLAWLTPRWYRGAAAYNIVFYEIPRVSPDAWKELELLGVPGKDKSYIGSYAAMDAVRTREWFVEFSRQVPYSKLFWFDLQHPKRALAMMGDALNQAVNVRAGIGNFCLEDGYPPYAMTQHFTSWSRSRAKLFHAWPLHIFIWYIVATIAAIVFAIGARSLPAKRTAIICVAILCMGLLEFALASLADALETDRHLFLFHALTDVSICFAFAGVLHVSSPLFQNSQEALRTS